MLKISLLSLGCDKNLVDSEEMLALINNEGYTIVSFEEEADIAVINTCCFINDAKEESINVLIEAEERKKAGELKGIIVTGCLAERYHKEIRDEFPGVDVILGTNSFDEIIKAVKDIEEGKKNDYLNKIDDTPAFVRERVLSTGGHYAYLKIAEGCDKRCTYCIIPYIRGRYRSIPMEDLIGQAELLADKGVKELIIVAQETTLYGTDLYGKKMLPKLLDALSLIEGIEWIRLMYCYPEEINDELIDEIASNKKICRYIDIPIQHASDEILRRMGRRTDSADIRDIIGRLRTKIPDINIRTTLITGFPGESDDDHEKLLSFVEEMKFERLGTFKYSPEEGTPAALFDDQIDEEVKDERYDDIMSLQQDIVFEKNDKMADKILRVIVEGYIPEDEVYVGRSEYDAPDIDGLVFFKYQGELLSGDFVTVRIEKSSGYDLIGEYINEPA